VIDTLQRHAFDRRRTVPIVASIVLTTLIGVGVGWGGWLIAAAVGAALVVAVLAGSGPFVILIVLLCTGPFLQGRFLDLTPGLPSIDIGRVLLPLAGVTLFVDWLARKKTPLRIELEDYLLLMFVGWGAALVLVQREGDLRFQLYDFSQYTLPLIGYAVVKSTVRTRKSLSVLMFAPVLLLLAVSSFAPIEALTGTSVYGVASERMGGVIRVQSTFGAAWEFGTVAGMLLALSVHSLSNGVSGTLRVLASLAVLLGSIAIILTFMRASWLALFAVMMITLWQIRRLRVPAVLAALPFLVLAVLLLPILAQSEVWSDRIAQDVTVLGREDLSQQQLALFARNPIVGSGLGNLTQTKYNLGIYFAAMSHNSYLSHLLSFGVIGLTYFAAVAVILAKSFGIYRRLPQSQFVGKELVAALWGAAAVYLIESASIEIIIFPFPCFLFWVIMGLLTVVGNHDFASPASTKHTVTS
jgi:O-antigen ligase